MRNFKRSHKRSQMEIMETIGDENEDFQHCTTLAGGQAMGLVMMISNGMTGLLALVVAAAVLHKEYGAGWMKQLLST